MQGTNPTEFEKWYSKKSGYSIEFLIASRKRTPIGTYYQQESIQSIYEAFMAGRLNPLMQGTNSTERKINIPAELSENTADLVVKFAEAMAEKLHKSEKKYGYSDEWMANSWGLDCKNQFMRHIQKGDPVDVANYCAFMFYHGWSTMLPPMPEGE